MDPEIITKTIFQYSDVLPDETIDFLKDIANDYGKVKNYIYKRYSGLNSLDKLTPGYDVLNEMRNFRHIRASSLFKSHFAVCCG